MFKFSSIWCWQVWIKFINSRKFDESVIKHSKNLKGMITSKLILCTVHKGLVWSILRKVEGEDAYYTTVDKKTKEA